MSKYGLNNVLLSFSVTYIYVKMKQHTYSDLLIKIYKENVIILIFVILNDQNYCYNEWHFSECLVNQGKNVW